MDESRIKEIIEKSLAGKATPDELSLLEQWYDSFEAKEGLTDQMNANQKLQTGDRMFAGIRHSIDPAESEEKKKRVIVFQYRPLMIAASVIILLGLAVFAYLLLSSPAKTDLPPLVEVTGTDQQVTRTALPDGSTVWLNGSCTIRYDKNFIKETREIWLDGEAYFSVVSRENHPFIVHAGKLNVSVVGTEFNIKMDKSDPLTVVTVTKGKVSVEAGQQVLGVLAANEEISYTGDTETKQNIKHVSPDVAISWKTGSLIFKETSFDAIAKKLESKFNITIDFADPGVDKCLLTASFDSTVNADQILNMLCKINGNKLVKQNNRYSISGKPCR